MTAQTDGHRICTFHKCGSNWFREIFWQVAAMQDRDYVPASNTVMTSGVNAPVTRSGQPLRIFPGGYADKIDTACGAGTAGRSTFILCLRDPRDALVSQYYSWKYSHKNNSSQRLVKARAKLTEMSEREGITLLIEEKLLVFADQIAPWIDRISSEDGELL